MSNKSSSKDDYGSPLPKKASPNPQLLLGSPSYISKAITPISSQKGKGAFSALVTPSQFTRGLTASPSSRVMTNKKLPFYTPPPGEKSKFVIKDFTVPIIPLEESYGTITEPMSTLLNKVFLKETYFLNSDISKTRQYYEFILIDTDSITLTHQRDEITGFIKYSKFKINKILSSEDWGQPPFHSRDFSRKFIPQYYTYLDYMDAWSYLLTVRPYDHTWFIWFNKSISLKFPVWFIKWFEVYGLETHIFPDYVLKAYNKFLEATACPRHKSLLSFTAIFGVTWILSWSIVTDIIWPEANAYHLSRQISIKWWDSFNPELLSQSALANWFAKNPKLCKPVITPLNDTTFLADKSKMLASLAAITNPQEFAKRLQEITAISECHSSTSSTEDIPVNNNEDDCYGIFD